MSDKTIAAMTLALEALEHHGGNLPWNAFVEVRKDLREALANARQVRLGPAIQECYGDCPTNPETCQNPCKFEGRPKPLAQHKIEEQIRA